MAGGGHIEHLGILFLYSFFLFLKYILYFKKVSPFDIRFFLIRPVWILHLSILGLWGFFFFFGNSQVISLQSKEVVGYCVCLCVFQAAEEGGETVACYSVCVSLVEGEETANSRWSVQRKLTEFQMLHRKLTEVTRHQSCTHGSTAAALLFKCLMSPAQ